MCACEHTPLNEHGDMDIPPRNTPNEVKFEGKKEGLHAPRLFRHLDPLLKP